MMAFIEYYENYNASAYLTDDESAPESCSDVCDDGKQIYADGIDCSANIRDSDLDCDHFRAQFPSGNISADGNVGDHGDDDCADDADDVGPSAAWAGYANSEQAEEP